MLRLLLLYILPIAIIVILFLIEPILSLLGLLLWLGANVGSWRHK